MGQTFKEVDKDSKVVKEIKKSGLSLAINFSKDDLKRFNLSLGDEIDLSNAEILSKQKA